jgi:hypothetical protein
VVTVSALADFDGRSGGTGSPTCRNDQDDTLADFSNWGPAIGIAAPGLCILSTYPVERGGYGTISGTSMASPHAAGASALLTSNGKPADAGGVRDIVETLVVSGNFGWTDDSGDGIKEPLLDITSFSPKLIAAGGDGGSGGDEGGGNTDPPPSSSITLSATGYKVTGLKKADLSWSGATSTNVDVHRDGAVVTTTANDGAYTDPINTRGGGSHTYKVCEAGTTTCSNAATVSF